MATSALIGIKSYGEKSTRIKAIYVHNDGGLWSRGVGETLLKHYAEPREIKELLKLGDCSELNDSVDSSVFYERDRGEDRSATEAEIYTPVEWEEIVEHSGNDFFYVWDGEWTVRTPSTEPIALTTAIAEYQSTLAGH